MIILLSNDDGIYADGLKALEAALEPMGAEVWVVAPDRQQSATSHSLTLHRPLRVEEVGPRKLAVDGTPTDCVNLAVNGEIHLWTPPQVRIASIELPRGSEDYLVVEGLGTPWVILRIAASPDMPASLALPVTFGGDLSEPFQLGLFDILEERDENAPLVSVHFEVP